MKTVKSDNFQQKCSFQIVSGPTKIEIFSSPIEYPGRFPFNIKIPVWICGNSQTSRAHGTREEILLLARHSGRGKGKWTGSDRMQRDIFENIGISTFRTSFRFRGYPKFFKIFTGNFRVPFEFRPECRKLFLNGNLSLICISSLL